MRQDSYAFSLGAIGILDTTTVTVSVVHSFDLCVVTAAPLEPSKSNLLRFHLVASQDSLLDAGAVFPFLVTATHQRFCICIIFHVIGRRYSHFKI